MTHATDFWEHPTRQLVGGRDVILVGSVPAVWADHAARLTAAGASRILVVATEGAGLGPGPDVPTLVIDQPGSPGLLERVRISNRTIANPPDHMLAALAEFDPRREAVVISSFLNESPTLDGRPIVDFRRPEWVALEDKTRADALWDRAGVARQPAEVVAVADAPAAARALDRGDGTVWAGDARDGYHGGAQLTRWVHDGATQRTALAELAARCDTVRVMPFLEGVPCSIHAIVVPDGVAVLRPVEMLTLRHRGGLLYAGCATFWDPPAATRTQMRDAARRTADVLRADVAFRGTFTIDGIAASDGFWPTELNPRYGAGLNAIARAAGIPILLVHTLAVAGRDVGIDAAGLERALVDAADTHRGGGTWLLDRSARASDPRAVRFDGEAWHWAEPDELADGTFAAGADFARCAFEPQRTPIGPSVAPRAAALWNFVAPQIDVDLGLVTAARD